MPLTNKGDEIMKAMKGQYGSKKGKSVFYASKNSGKISGVESRESLKRRFAENMLSRAHDKDDLGRKVAKATGGVAGGSMAESIGKFAHKLRRGRKG